MQVENVIFKNSLDIFCHFNCKINLYIKIHFKVHSVGFGEKVEVNSGLPVNVKGKHACFLPTSNRIYATEKHSCSEHCFVIKTAYTLVEWVPVPVEKCAWNPHKLLKIPESTNIIWLRTVCKYECRLGL